ncbi:ETC complex I subunit [Pelagibius litoralis]|uniref:ETC complex I subunit n=1 Tax=Pelagibius litoralis TaxID=374515 RepID=A0A967EX14_9PROT|nr:ETC complex I subunit [Pelagibius litoralis]NIA67175.1 ETC complex I subunit [Pelagibius litoralis]
MQVRIYQPPKTAMQSGRARAKVWMMEFEPTAARQVEPLMGWTSSADTRAQLRLRFESLEEAIDYAKAEGLMYSVEKPRERKVKARAYADNFKYDRMGRWTH